MKTRIITALIALPLLAVCLFVLPQIVTAFVAAVACAVACWELLHNTGLIKHLRPCLYSAAAAFLMPLWCYYGRPILWANVAVLVLFCLLFMEVMVSGMRLRVEKIALCVMGGLVIPYMLSSVVRILAGEYGRWYVAVPFVIAFVSDSGAYFFGKYLGRHKMTPKMSPHKTWEGLAGGVLLSVAVMLVFMRLFDAFVGFRESYLVAGIYGLSGALLGAFGDLCFSVIKRQTGIKDFGNLLPGHGGILDRFDSFVTISIFIEIMMTILPLGIQ